MPSRKQIPVSYCQPLRKRRQPQPHSLLVLDVVHMALQCVYKPSSAFHHLKLHFVLDRIRSRHVSQALLAPTGDSLGRNWPFSLLTEQASKHDHNNVATTGNHSCRSLGEVQGTAAFGILLTPTLLNTLIPAFSPDNAYHFEKPSPLLHHMDNLKAVLLNYLLINWLLSWPSQIARG